MILINNKRKYRFADSLPYVIEKYKEGGSGVTVRKKTLFIYTKFVTLATLYLENLRCNDPYRNLTSICHAFSSIIRISCNSCAT